MSSSPQPVTSSADRIRPRASRAALWGALGAVAAGLAAVGTVIALAVRAG